MIKKAVPENVLSPTLAYGEIKMTIAILMVTTGFVRTTKKKPSQQHPSSDVSTVEPPLCITGTRITSKYVVILTMLW